MIYLKKKKSSVNWTLPNLKLFNCKRPCEVNEKQAIEWEITFVNHIFIEDFASRIHI